MGEGPPIPVEEKLDKDAFDKQWAHDKVVRHMENVSGLTGWYHGQFFRDGIAQETKPKTTDKPHT